MKERKISLDLMRILAIIFVVIIHVSFPLLDYFNKNINIWWIGNFFNSVSRWSVPVFFMISGALILNNQENIKIEIFLKKILRRLVLPLLLWTLIYSFLRHFQTNESISVIILKALGGSIFFHLWFMYVLIGLYLIAPIILLVIKNSDSKKILKYYLVFWTITSGVLPVFKLLGINFYTIEYFNGYLGYFILGYYLNTAGQNVKFRHRNLILGIFIMFFSSLIGTYFVSAYKGIYIDIFHQYLNVFVILQSVFIFILFNRVSFDNFSILNKLIRTTKFNIGRICFGVYMFHPIILGLLKIGFKGIQIDAFFINPALGVLLTTLLCTTISFAVFICISKLERFKVVRLISKYYF